MNEAEGTTKVTMDIYLLCMKGKRNYNMSKV